MLSCLIINFALALMRPALGVLSKLFFKVISIIVQAMELRVSKQCPCAFLKSTKGTLLFRYIFLIHFFIIINN